jgi:hypothetical protein
LYLKAVAFEHIVVQIRTIARTIFDLSVDRNLPKLAQHELSAGLFAASKAVRKKVDVIKSDDIFSATDEIAEDLRNAGHVLAQELIKQRNELAQEVLVRTLSIVSNIQIIADSLDESSPALHDVMTPDEGPENRILKVPVNVQSKTLLRRIWRLVRIFLRR